jgi:hypothetical protein
LSFALWFLGVGPWVLGGGFEVGCFCVGVVAKKNLAMFRIVRIFALHLLHVL